MLYKKHSSKIITIGNLILFVISIIIGSYSGKNIPPLLQVRTVIIIALVIFACLSPVLIMSSIKSLRRFLIDEEIEEKNIILSGKLNDLANILKVSTEKLDKSIDQNKDYFEKAKTHMDGCPGIDNLVRRSYMINSVDEYYQHLIKARENTDEKEVYLTNFSTKPYIIGNKNCDEYYSTNIDFVKRAKCNVYRIVTVHSHEKLVVLKNLFDEAKESNSEKYHLAYLDIERFSDETGDTLPGIVGMDIFENEVIIMDFRYARALRKNNGFEKPLYIESKEIAGMCRAYYKDIWNDISDENSTSKHKYKGYILYSGTLRKPHEDIDNIWKKIENKITAKNPRARNGA